MTSPSPEVLLIHQGKKDAADCVINLLPMGVLSMADWLTRHGHPAEVIHLPIEHRLDPRFDFGDTLRRAAPRVVGLDLHWHQQSHAAIEAARQVRAALPDAAIVLGGYTASAYAEEILKEFPFVDFVIRGDGEVALLELVRAWQAHDALDGVANLSYRKGNRVRRSARIHVNDAEDLGRFCFSSFELLRHHRFYTQGRLMEGVIDVEGPLRPGIFYCNCGRGCRYNCSFCGGARDAQRKLGGRQHFAHRPADAMLRDLRRMPDFNLEGWYNTFDPTPDQSYFLDLFARIRAEGLQLSMMHECLHLPGDEFLESFARTFGARKRLDFVLLTASDGLRMRNKDNYFSRDDLLRTLQATEHLGIASDVCFLTGMPFERAEHVQESLRFVEELGRRFDHVHINCEVLAIEPLAPMNTDPEMWGVRSHAQSFMDYYRGHAAPLFEGFTPEAHSFAQAHELAQAHMHVFAAARGARGAGHPSSPSPEAAPEQAEPPSAPRCEPRSATGDPAPAREDITVTLQCNNHCRFCPRSALSHLRVRSDEELDERLRAIRAHSTRVLLSGGEITLVPDVVELLARCRAHGFEQIAIVTNGRRLKDMVFARRLVDAGLTEACVSIYGLDPEVHDAMTSRPGSLVETLAGLDNLLALAAEHRSLSVRINTLLAADNAAGMLELLRGLARRGVRRFLVAEMMLSDAFPVALDHAEVAKIAGAAAADPELGDSVVTWRGFPLCLFGDLPEVLAEAHDVDTAGGAVEDLDTYFAEFYRSFRQVEACGSCAAKGRCPGLQLRYLEQHEPRLVSPLAAVPALRRTRDRRAVPPMPTLDPGAVEAAARELADLPPWPDHARLVVLPTTACPFRCTYCNVELSRRDASPETLDRAVDLLLTSRRDHLELQFFGGEPLIQRSEVIRTMRRGAELARQRGKRLDFVVTTSGLLLDDELLAELRAQQAQVLFSLDGSPEVMARYRPLHRGSSDPAPIIERNLAKLIASGVRHFVNLVVTPDAAADLPARMRYVAGLGVSTVQICYTLGAGWDPDARARYCAALEKCAELIARGEVKLRLQNLTGAAEPTVLSTDIMVDVDGTLYGDAALFGEKVFPGLREPYRIGHISGLPSYDGLRRTREQNLVLLRSTYPDVDSPPRRMLEEQLALGHEIERTGTRIRDTRPRASRRQLPQPTLQGHAHAVDDNPLQKLVLRRSLAHQARIMAKRPELLALPMLMLDSACYHDCLFCLSKPLPPTPLSEVERWLADNEELGLERLGIAGNEPLAHPQIDSILREARRVGFSHFEVLTSAAPLSDASRARALFELGVRSYAIPLYAADAAIHDAITQAPGSHAATLAAIEHLLELGADMHIHCNLLRQNLAALGALEELVTKTWGLPLAIIPIRPKAANLPFDQLVPRYADVVAEAKVRSLVAIPLCVAAKVQSPARPSGDIIADVLKLYVLDQPFVKPDKCKPCRLRQGCSGTFQAYLDLHGDDELEPA